MVINFWNYNRIQCTHNANKLHGITRIAKYVLRTRISKLSVIILLPRDELLIPNRFPPVGFRITKKNILKAMVEWRMPRADKYPSVRSPL